MSSSNFLYLLFIVGSFYFCCLFVCIEAQFVGGRRRRPGTVHKPKPRPQPKAPPKPTAPPAPVFKRGDYPKVISYQLFPVLVEKYKPAKVPDSDSEFMGIKVYLNDKNFEDELCVWYAFPFDANETRYEFEEGENFTNPERAGFPLDDNFSTRLYFSKSFEHHWNYRNHAKDYEDVKKIESKDGFRWTKKNQTFELVFSTYGYRVMFKLNTLCKDDWYSLRCDYFCKTNRAHVLSCDENLGTMCYAGYKPTKEGYCVWTDVCKANPKVCQNSGTCLTLPDLPDFYESYRCICKKGFTGQHCEKTKKKPMKLILPNIFGDGGPRKDLHNSLQLCLKLWVFLSSLSVIKFMVQTVWL